MDRNNGTSTDTNVNNLILRVQQHASCNVSYGRDNFENELRLKPNGLNIIHAASTISQTYDTYPSYPSYLNNPSVISSDKQYRNGYIRSPPGFPIIEKLIPPQSVVKEHTQGICSVCVCLFFAVFIFP